MKPSFVYIALFLFSTSIFSISCTNGTEKESANIASEMMADSSSIIPDNSNLTKNEALKNKKFIRTAESKFRVKDVKQTTQRIHDLTNKYGGYVSSMSLKSEPTKSKKVQISADSLAKVERFIVCNELTIRVPNQQLDSLLRDIFQMVDYWDNCELKTDDASLLLLANSMKAKRLESFSDRNKANIDKKKGNITIASEAEKEVLNYENQADNYKVDQQSIEDRVNFSVVNLQIYQAESIQKTAIPDIKNIEPYHPNIFLQVGDSLKDGWLVLEDLLVFLMKFWPLWTVGGVVYYFVRRKTLKVS
ncbi:hypothetical protein GCM10011514_27820 [Emticicia aquatilis]|uniref:DUF4349 domain-containing protein n=1 Tax=Emticicia aquatilis TaxID=1537369 RepID=A0A917DRM7_9BACT|nr:DUF4349 domain-containing protein [Emticicia aquatilis]GGD62153.1 hypothetical protein GCM10011514_27820 [Emticicia aquatilis]